MHQVGQPERQAVDQAGAAAVRRIERLDECQRGFPLHPFVSSSDPVLRDALAHLCIERFGCGDIDRLAREAARAGFRSEALARSCPSGDEDNRHTSLRSLLAVIISRGHDNTISRTTACASGAFLRIRKGNDGRRCVGFAGAMAMAMAMDALMGWPAGLFARIGHPVTWLGALINVLDARSNRHADAPALRRASGIVAALLVIALAAGFRWVLQVEFSTGWSRVVLVGVMSLSLVSPRFLPYRVSAVSRPLLAGD